MTAAVPTTAVAVFFEHEKAEKALDALHHAGFRPDQIGVAVRKGEATQEKPPESSGSKTEEGAVTGVVAGGALGALAGAVATGLIPGVGPIIAAGILAGTLGGAGAGATAGGVLGALIGHGVPEADARHYEQEVAAGKTIVTVKADGRYNEAVDILRKHGEYGKGSPLI
jgi:hypothetical protein